MRLALLCGLVGSLASAQPVAAQTTLLVLNSQPGDYIGQGISQTITPADGVFTPSRNYANGVTVTFFGFQPGNFWILDFAAPGAAPLAVGSYEHATRFPFQLPTDPGLDVDGDGRGCNTLTGRFDVLQVTYGNSGEVVAFAADFEQHCEGASAALLGSIRFNAGPIPVRCHSDVTSFGALTTAVLALNTSDASKAVLIDALKKADAASKTQDGTWARQWILIFQHEVVRRSELAGRNPQRIEPLAASALICGASNLLINLMS